MAKKKPQSNLAHIYQHTNIAVYLVGFVAVASLIYDSTQVITEFDLLVWRSLSPNSYYKNATNDLRLQGIVQKYELNRKWFYLYGEELQG